MIWTLTISSFVGIVPGAYHYFGRLVCRERGVAIDLERPMPTKDRIEANRREGWAVFTEGTMTCSFESEHEVKATAAVEFDRQREPGDILVCGLTCVAGPQEPLGPAEFLVEALPLWQAFESVDGWGVKRRGRDDPDEIAARRVAEVWDALVARFQAVPVSEKGGAA